MLILDFHGSDARAVKSFVRIPVIVLSFAAWLLARQSPDGHYAGSEACAACHRAISESQSKTAMANTWHGSNATFHSLSFNEGPAHYQVLPGADHLQFSVAGGKEKFEVPVQAMVGGKRHGISFLLKLKEIDGLPLERPALLEGRYALSHLGSLVLSPGFQKEQPNNYEDELGRVLSPTFETRCLTCHGQPGTLGAGKQGGVRCETCHGAAAAHLVSVTGKTNSQPMVKPESLHGTKGMEVCAQCHSGLTTAGHSDPLPEDLLVSSQVPALRNSECFIQSGEQLTCTGCHDPHADSPTVVQTSVNTCLTCHSLAVPQHAAICPVNRTQGCVQCHMPTVQADFFHLTDHWIRVHPKAGPKAAGLIAQTHDASLASQVVPKREFLRLIVADSDENMKAVTDRLAKGDSFSSVAHDLSIDATAPGGGFIGDEALADMDPKLAAAVDHLPHGANSAVVNSGNNRMILHRLPRDFRWDADQLYLAALNLKAHGDAAGAIAKNQEALSVYPYFLRGLILMGTMLGQAGDANRASGILRFAADFYPKDAASQFNLALTLSKQPAAQIEALRRTLDLDPDMVAAYQSLGSALYATGQPKAAIETFRSGLQIDPLSAVLYYDLGLALQEQGDSTGARTALRLAARLDPEIAARKQ